MELFCCDVFEEANSSAFSLFSGSVHIESWLCLSASIRQLVRNYSPPLVAVLKINK